MQWPLRLFPIFCAFLIRKTFTISVITKPHQRQFLVLSLEINSQIVMATALIFALASLSKEKESTAVTICFNFSDLSWLG